jgi:hypothetical protein
MAIKKREYTEKEEVENTYMETEYACDGCGVSLGTETYDIDGRCVEKRKPRGELNIELRVPDSFDDDEWDLGLKDSANLIFCKECVNKCNLKELVKEFIKNGKDEEAKD